MDVMVEIYEFPIFLLFSQTDFDLSYLSFYRVDCS